MCTGAEVGALAVAALGTAETVRQNKKSERAAEKAADRPTFDPEAEREAVRQRSSRARARARGGFSSADTTRGLAGGSGLGAKTLLGG